MCEPSYCCADACLERADVVFVVDNSATIRFFLLEYRHVLDFIVKVVAQLDVDSGKVRVSVITVSDTPTIHFRLSTYHTRMDVVEAVRRLPYRGYTANIGTALGILRTDILRSISDTLILHAVVYTCSYHSTYNKVGYIYTRCIKAKKQTILGIF